MLGYSAEEMVGYSISDFIIDEPLPASSRAPAGNLQTLEMAQRTFRKKDGSTVPVLMRHKLIQDPYGQLRGMRSTLQDISALKRTEQELRDAEEKYRSIFENAIEGIFQSTPAGIFRSVNPALAALYGYVSPEEMIRAVTDISVQLYLDPDRRTEFVRRLDDHGELTDFESEVTRRDGTTLWISERARVVRDASGAVAYYEGTVEDVTAKRQAEGAMTSARDSALESVRLKSEFLANMSHEIRTPMNGIIGMTGLLLDTELSHKQRDFTQTISNSADALLTIINDILDFSKIEAGMLNFEELDFQLGSVVEGAVDLLADRALSKNLELASLVYSDVPVALCGDPGRLRQVLTNLIGNAIKFTDSGEVTVKAKKVEETDEDALLRFSIVDSGIGITPDQQKRLFQAFIQADGSTTRRYGGTGLGLAICKQLVEQMRGEIGVTSTAGKGSTFWFTARFRKQRHAIAFVGPERSQLRGVRALIVDDNDTNRKILHHLFQAWGVHDAQASSGAEALALLDEAASGNEPFDLAVLDMQMPEMDGGMLARKIKADPRFAAIRLVMMTSLDRSEDPIAMREAGFEAYLTKPVKQSPLFDCLVTVMSRNSQPRNVLPVLLPKPEATPAGGHAACGRALRILIVEDNIVNQKVALHQLQKLGHLADAADNGQLALDTLRRAPYDFIFMDCQMPELDGYEATRELRRIEGESRHTWVVAMTAHSLTGDRDKCLAAGMDDYLSKPVKSEDLAAALARFQGVSQADSDSDERNSETPTTIDRNLLNGFRDLDQDGGDSILGKLIDLFLENTPVVLKDAHAALATQASPQLARAAHSLKGSCSNFGAERMRQLCSDLEQQAHGGDFDRSAELLGRIEKEFRHVRMALERERPSRVA